MYINCQNGEISQHIEQDELMELFFSSIDEEFIYPNSLEEILENMHMHNKPTLQNLKNNLEL